MFCPYCDKGKTIVIDTADYKHTTVRRRRCKECKITFTTLETSEVDEKQTGYVLSCKVHGLLQDGRFINDKD